MVHFKRLSVVEALKFGFTTFLDNVWLYGKIIVVTMVPYLLIWALIVNSLVVYQAEIFNFPAFLITTGPIKTMLLSPLSFLWIALLVAFTEYLAYQYIRVGLRLYDKQKIDWKDFFVPPSERFFVYFLARMWYLLKVLVGLCLFIVPGIYIAVKNYFVGFSIIDKKTMMRKEDTLYAQKLSNQIKWPLFILVIVLSFLLGFTAFTFLFLPFISLTQVHAYKQLMKNEEF